VFVGATPQHGQLSGHLRGVAVLREIAWQAQLIPVLKWRICHAESTGDIGEPSNEQFYLL
jgi:hypothetical protein